MCLEAETDHYNLKVSSNEVPLTSGILYLVHVLNHGVHVFFDVPVLDLSQDLEKNGSVEHEEGLLRRTGSFAL